jgi:hypothetical protein
MPKGVAKGVDSNKYRDWRGLTDDSSTPFDRSILERVRGELESLPKVGEPYNPRAGKSYVGGESYKQMRLSLIPAIVSMYEKGYTKDMVIEKLTEMLGVGRTNRFVKRVVQDGHEEYLGKYFGR